MRVGIVGLGVVGSAVRDGLRQIGHKLQHYDIKDPRSSLESLINSEIIFVCVPTASQDDGSCDTSVVESTIKNLHQLNFSGIIAIKSTVVPGTTERLIKQYPTMNICFVPEFLRERSALTDFTDGHDILIVGSNDPKISDVIVECHLHIPHNYIQVTPTEAEIAKYFCNVFNSLRITFANGMFEICQAMGADYQQVFQAVTQRSNITPDYLRCGEDYRGFEGHCLPKDSKALAMFVKQLGLKAELFDAIIKDNERYIK